MSCAAPRHVDSEHDVFALPIAENADHDGATSANDVQNGKLLGQLDGIVKRNGYEDIEQSALSGRPPPPRMSAGSRFMLTSAGVIKRRSQQESVQVTVRFGVQVTRLGMQAPGGSRPRAADLHSSQGRPQGRLKVRAGRTREQYCSRALEAGPASRHSAIPGYFPASGRPATAPSPRDLQ